MAHSTMSAVKTALVTQLTARAGLTGVQVSYARPNEAKLKREALWFGRAVGTHDIKLVSAGRKKRDETYHLGCTVRIAHPGKTAELADQRAIVVAGEVEDLLAADPTIAGALPPPNWLLLATYELDNEPRDEGWISWARLELVVHARLA